jgi:hypothetical protein
MHPLDEKNPQENTETTPSQSEKKEESVREKSYPIIHNPGFPWIIIGILLLILVGVIWKYEHTPFPERKNTYYHLPPMQVYHVDPWSRWGMWERELDRHFQRMHTYQESLWREVEQSRSMSNAVGKYSGTRMINDETFSYSLDIGENTLTGNLSGSNSGMLEGIIKNIESLGYTVEKKEAEYSISGEKNNSPELLEILRK